MQVGTKTAMQSVRQSSMGVGEGGVSSINNHQFWVFKIGMP